MSEENLVLIFLAVATVGAILVSKYTRWVIDRPRN